MIDSPSTEQKALPATLITCLIIFITVVLTFSSSFEYEFVNWDDGALVQNNPFIQSFNVDNLQAMVFSIHAASWHPLTWLSYALDIFIFDAFSAHGHHITNVFLHGMNSIWIFFLFRFILLRSRPDLKNNIAPYLGAIVASLFFGLNPLRVESVAWISGRKDLLCAFFFIPALIAYIKFTSTNLEPNRRLWYWTCLSCHLFALLSKGMAMTLPVILILLDIYPMNRLNYWKDIPRLLYEKIPFFLLSIADAVIVLLGVKQYGSVVSTDIFSWKIKILNSIQSLILYIQKILLPTGLSPYYPFKEQLLVMDSYFVLSLFLLTGASAFVFLKYRSGQRFWMVAFFYFLVTITPVIGLVQIGSAAIADRYTYLPTLSCIFLIAGAITIGVDKNSLRMICLARITTVTVLVCFYFLSVKQTKIWSNSISLWSQVTSVYPGRSHVAHANLGQGFKAYGNYDRALMEYKTANRITPNKATLLNNIGVLYMQKNRMDQAIAYYKRTLAVDPGYTNARNNLGYAYYRKGWLVKAENALNLAIQLQPGMNLIYINLGMVYLKQGKLNKAEKNFKQAIKMRPSFSEAYNQLGQLYQRKGMPEKAGLQFKLARFWSQLSDKIPAAERKRMRRTLNENQ